MADLQTVIEEAGQVHPVAQVMPKISAMSIGWEITTVLMGGTSAIRATGKKHLPQFPKEEDENYKRRLNSSTLFPAYRRTVTTLTGKPFSQPISYEDDTIDEQLKALFPNIDREGQTLDVYTQNFTGSTLAHGIAGILVDYPDRADTPNTIEAEKAKGLRPYFVKIMFWNVLGYQFNTVNGQNVLTQFRFYEYVTEAKDAYNVQTIRQIRVINTATWEIWRYSNELKTWVLFKFGPNTLGEVPFFPAYGEYVDYMEGKPPLLELGHMNIKHWQSQSDQDNIMHVARVPILVVATDDEDFTLDVSGNVGVRIPIGSQAAFVEHTGKAIEAGAKSLAELKDEMRQAGAELLVMRMTQATATEVSTDNSVGMSALQTMVLGINDTLNAALACMCRWMKVAKVEPKVKIHTEFGLESLDSATAQLILDMAEATRPVISAERVYIEYQRRGILSPTITWTEEKDRIDKQPKLEVPPLIKPGLPGAPKPPQNNA